MLSKKSLLKLVVFFLGLAFLVTTVVQLGPGQIWIHLSSLKFRFFWVFLISVAWTFAYTLGWWEFFSSRLPSFFHLLKLRILGESVNIVTPLGFVAGDPFRIFYFDPAFDKTTVIASVVSERLLNILASIFFVVLSLMVMGLEGVNLGPLTSFSIGGIYIVVLAALTGLLFLLFSEGGGETVTRILAPIVPKKFRPAFRAKMEVMLTEFRSFGGGRFAPRLRAFLWHLSGRILGGLEIAAILYFLTGGSHVIFSFFMAAVTAVAYTVFTFVPAGIGVIESVYAGVFHIFGLDPALGVTVQIIRRLRSICWVLIGAFLLKNLKKEKPKKSS